MTVSFGVQCTSANWYLDVIVVKDPLKGYRRKLRAWLKDVKLRHESRRYDTIFKSRHLKIPSEATIRQVLKSKFPHLRAKEKGNLNILAIYHDYNWENTSLRPALEKFGSVRHYDWFNQFNHQDKDWARSIKRRMNDDLVDWAEKSARTTGTDVVFAYLSGEIVTAETVCKIRGLGVPMVNMFLNDKEGFVGKVRKGRAMGSRDICRYFDLSWTSTEDALKKYCVEGALPVYLPEGANPEIHKPYDVEKAIDVSFVGQRYGNRPETVATLRRQGIQVEAYGPGWPGGPLSTEEMVSVYSRTKINLGFAGVAGAKGTYCLKGRDFEIPMSGGLYLTEFHPELERWFDVGREIVAYVDYDDLVCRVRFLLSNPQTADEIRKRGLQRARREHTWEMRFEKIFSLFGLI